MDTALIRVLFYAAAPALTVLGSSVVMPILIAAAADTPQSCAIGGDGTASAATEDPWRSRGKAAVGNPQQALVMPALPSLYGPFFGHHFVHRTVGQAAGACLPRPKPRAHYVNSGPCHWAGVCG
jgi:hypothetical protein